MHRGIYFHLKLRALNNTKIFEMIHCNIYFSPLKQLVLSRVPRTKGVDFTGYISQPRSPLASQNDDDLSLIWSNQSSQEIYDDTDDEEPPISNERLKEIRAKLDLIDNEIQLKIEENYQNAINKLNRKILVLSVDFRLNLNVKAVYNLCGLFGNIVTQCFITLRPSLASRNRSSTLELMALILFSL